MTGSGAGASILIASTVVLMRCAASSPSNAPIPIDQFCSRFAASFCALRDACECPLYPTCTSPDAGGPSAQQKNCQDEFFSTQTRAAMDAGHIHYDPGAAAALVTRLDARPPDCRDAVAALGLTFRNVGTLAGVFTGTLPVGSACMTGSPPNASSGLSPSDCVSPAFCNSSVCTKPEFFGDPCVGPSMTCVVEPGFGHDDYAARAPIAGAAARVRVHCSPGSAHALPRSCARLGNGVALASARQCNRAGFFSTACCGVGLHLSLRRQTSPRLHSRENPRGSRRTQDDVKKNNRGRASHKNDVLGGHWSRCLAVNVCQPPLYGRP